MTQSTQDDLSAFAESWLRGKTAADFDVIEHLGGRLLWPEKLTRKRAPEDGKPGKLRVTEEPVYLQTLDPLDRAQALEEATRFFDERGFKITDPRHAPLWSEIEMHARVSMALREHEPMADGTRARKHTLLDLLSHKVSGISSAEVSRLDDLVQQFDRFESVKLQKVDKELAVRVALAIAEVRNCTPLVAIEPSAQDICLVYICALLGSYLTHSTPGRPSSPSPASSTPAP